MAVRTGGVAAVEVTSWSKHRWGLAYKPATDAIANRCWGPEGYSGLRSGREHTILLLCRVRAGGETVQLECRASGVCDGWSLPRKAEESPFGTA